MVGTLASTGLTVRLRTFRETYPRVRLHLRTALSQEVSAVVVLKPGVTLDADALTAFVREQLAYFKVPTRWIVGRTALPRTASGKVVRADVLAELGE